MARTIDAARGHWKGILATFGIASSMLTGKHGPCPLCGGKDRFRYDNKDGNGSWFCNVCGAGDGMELLKRYRQWDFRTAAAEVDKVVGNVAPDPARRSLPDDTKRRLQQSLWQSSVPIVPGDQAHRYLSSRCPMPATLPNCLRYAHSCPAPDQIRRPALIALVSDHAGDPVNLHRTFLGPNGKADMEDPRATMAGSLPDGSAVRLYPTFGSRLGIAEGIETAFAAAARFRIPVWSALNATLLEKWVPPQGVTEVWVFGDNDKKFAGQAAAYRLAHRLAAQRNLKVEVKIPSSVGLDWADREAG